MKIPLKAIGNHEGVPVNQFEVGTNWLYQEIAEQWAKFNLHPDSFETIKRSVSERSDKKDGPTKVDGPT